MAIATRRRRIRIPGGTGGTQARLKTPNVDRLMWRTGFGPSDADRNKFTGRSLSSVVDDLLDRPQGRLVGPPPVVDRDGSKQPLEPTESDTDLTLEWMDRCIRTQNPLVERLTLFFHNLFATQRSEVSPPQLMITQNQLFRRYADLAANPGVTFKDLVAEVGEDAAMLRFLDGENSTDEDPNENYAREICELFCLGTVDKRGVPNYSEDDIREIARATTGWTIDDENPDDVKVEFDPDRFDSTPKTIFGKTGNWDHRDVVEMVTTQHHAHPRFFISKLWHEFIATPPPDATMADLIRTYKRSRTRILPVLRQILTDPLMLESPREPNMIKPPVVFTVGVMRALKLGIENNQLDSLTNAMGQRLYHPPTVAGWDPGIAWLNTNTAIARFNMVNRFLNDEELDLDDDEGENGTQAFKRAWESVGKPWMSPGARSSLLFYAKQIDKDDSKDNENNRRQRLRVLRSFMLGGPDAQVM